MFGRLRLLLDQSGDEAGPRSRSTRRRGRRRPALEGLEVRLVPSTVPAAIGYQSQAPSNPSSPSGTAPYQYVTAGSYQTVSSQQVTVGTGQTGLVNLSFQAQVRSNSPNDQVTVRYLIDGNPDPNDTAIGNTTGADAIANLAGNNYGNWTTLTLTHQLTLSPGTHTISVQVEGQATASGASGQDLVVYNPVLDLTEFNRGAAVGLQTQALANPSSPSGTAPYQYVTAGSYQTITTLPVTVGAGQSGTFDLSFQAQVRSNSSTDQVRVRYLIDGNADPNDLGITASNPLVADAVLPLDQNSYGNWGTLTLTHQLTLSPGTHTISVQVEGQATASGAGGHDLVVYDPVLNLTGYNQNAAVGFQTQALANSSNPAGPQQYQYVSAGSYQTVATQQVTVGANSTGLFDLAFQAQLRSSGTTDQVTVRYLIDGNPDPNDQAIGNTTGADAIQDLTEDLYEGWTTMSLRRQLTLSPGTHTISVQVENQTVSPGLGGEDLTVVAPVLHLTGYNTIAQASAGPTAFVLFNGGYLWEHQGTDPSSGWSNVVGNVAQVQAGEDASGNPAAFVLFNGGYLWEHQGTDPNSGWINLASNVASFATSERAADTVYVVFNGGYLYEHQGTNPGAGWSNVASNVAQVQAGVDASGNPAAFVLFNGGYLYEHRGTTASTGWTNLSSNVAGLSASQAAADTAFVLFNGGYLYQHQGTTASTGWTNLSSNVSRAQAGLSAAGTPAVFILYNNGAIWEHQGTDSNSGWSNVTAGVASDAASQTAADTVFVVFNHGYLYEHQGTDSSSGWTNLGGNVATVAVF